MKKRLTRLTVCGMLLFLAACGPNKAELRTQEMAQRDIGGQFIRAGDYTKALKHLVEAERLYADDPILQNYLGLAYNGKNKPELAIQHYEKALKLKPDYAPARNNLGAVYIKKKEYKNAEKYLKRSLSVRKDVSDTYYNFACLYSLRKKTGEALKYYKKGLAYFSAEQIKQSMRDPDLAYLRKEKEFKKLVEGYTD